MSPGSRLARAFPPFAPPSTAGRRGNKRAPCPSAFCELGARRDGLPRAGKLLAQACLRQQPSNGAVSFRPFFAASKKGRRSPGESGCPIQSPRSGTKLFPYHSKKMPIGWNSYASRDALNRVRQLGGAHCTSHHSLAMQPESVCPVSRLCWAGIFVFVIPVGKTPRQCL